MADSPIKDRYKCIFFDLDHTLWDYETSCKETLQELFAAFSLPEKGVTDFTSFHQQFRRVNAALWVLYDRGEIGSEVIRKERFRQILEALNAFDPKLSDDLSHEYLYTCPRKGNLMPHAIETLQYLSANYRLSVITNGFEEIQNMKLTAGNLHTYFDHIVTSQKAGHKKPAREIFTYTLEKNGISASEAMMIGDNLLTDIKGAREASIDAVFYNPEKSMHQEKVTREIESLHQLRSFL